VLAQPGGAPLGDAGPAPVVTTDRLAPGEVLLCFTDGLVERPGVALQSSIEELAVVASDAFRRGIPALTAMDPAERIADLTVERMTRDGHLDDVTLLVVRVTGAQVADLVIEVPAEAAQLGVLREALGGWLAEIGAGQADMVSIELAVLEAATNSIEHAYREPGGTVRVEGVIDDRGRACLTVIDHGFWRPPAVDPGHRGRGLTMMRACMDSVEIDNSYYGSTVLLDRQLRRAARLAGSGLSTVSAGRSGAGRKPTTLTVGLDRSETPRLVLSGPVDVHTGDELRRVLWDASRGGALPLTIDLSQVTHLGSVGVQLLFEFAEQATADRRMPTLIAPRGCPAHYPIALTGLDHLVTVAGS
jgi:anti-sigma regulatory factor (Ser/Thr protein kinase)/anti-anti-sigma regulatory factor